MNILLIGTTDILGGAAKVSWTLKQHLEEQGHEVSMFVADKRSDDPNVTVIPRQTWRKYLGFLLATDDLLSSDWIIKTDEFKKADIVHCHSLHGRFFNLRTLQKMSKLKPVVWTLHDEWAITPHCVYTYEGTEMKNGLYACKSINTPPRLLWDNTRYLSWRKNYLYKKSRLHIVTPSKWLLERVRNTVLKDQDIRLIYNGIESDIFKKSDKSEARKKLALPLDKKIVLFLADDPRNVAWKGWSISKKIIDDPKNSGDTLFLCVGNHEKYQNEAHILYKGHVESKQMLSLYYNAADVLLFTSLAENFPLVILEAMSAGLPIVAFDVGGIKEVVVHKENGYVARYNDMDDVKNGLDWVLNLDNTEKNRISASSATTIRQSFTVDRMNAEYENLYKELIKSNE